MVGGAVVGGGREEGLMAGRNLTLTHLTLVTLIDYFLGTNNLASVVYRVLIFSLKNLHQKNSIFPSKKILPDIEKVT